MSNILAFPAPPARTPIDDDRLDVEALRRRVAADLEAADEAVLAGEDLLAERLILAARAAAASHRRAS